MKPEIFIIAGPNGAGKTSFANAYFASVDTDMVMINADEIARHLAIRGIPENQLNMRAGREMLKLMDLLVRIKKSFSIETTLASLMYSRKLLEWKKAGYKITLLYLRLPSPTHAVSRVKKRVASGGHDIPKEDIRRRFKRSLDNLENIYKPLVDEWYIWDSLEDKYELAEAWNDNK